MDKILKLADENGLMKQKNKASFSEYFKVFLSTCKITQTHVITQMSVISQMSVIKDKTLDCDYHKNNDNKHDCNHDIKGKTS